MGTDDDGTCNISTEFWVKELHLLQNHHNDILLGRALTGDVINASQKLLSKQFPDIGGLQLTYYNDPRSFSCADGVQIHHTSQYHWITSTSIGSQRTCSAKVFDSMWNNELTAESEVQLAQIYGEKNEDLLRVEICSVHQQDGGVDCGIFAIAFATDLCHSLNPVAVTYDQNKMRPHLLRCLENQRLEPFPRKEERGIFNQRAIKTISLYCSCRLPERFDTNMIECENCFQWFHHKCVGISSSKVRTWLCSICSQPKKRRSNIQ